MRTAKAKSRKEADRERGMKTRPGCAENVAGNRVQANELMLTARKALHVKGKSPRRTAPGAFPPQAVDRN
jgi:hypothetical protein